MSSPRSLQEWVHWLELGAGGRGIRTGAFLIGLLLLSLIIGYKQFHGPRTEETLAQLVVARQLAEGKGYTTAVNFPQTSAWEAAHGRRFDPKRPLPEMHQPPFYSALVAASIRLAPSRLRATFFKNAPAPPDGFRADYWVLAVNIFLLWIAAGLTYSLGKELFDSVVGWTALLALVLSSAIWDHTVALDGTPLAMVLLLLLFYALFRADGASRERSAVIWAGGAGLAGGGLFLCDYTTVLAFPILVGAWVVFRTKNDRVGLGRVSVAVAALALVMAAWAVYTTRLTGAPLGLAWQGVALKAADSTADPEAVRAAYSVVTPTFDLDKFGNKGLSGLQQWLGGQFWSGGAYFLTAFFFAGLLYRFRSHRVNRLRWVFVATLFALVAAYSFFDSGESERLPSTYAVPLVAIFGAGFVGILISSSEVWANHSRWVLAGLLSLQAVPLLHNLLEPRRLHFQYPPYYPGLFVGMRDELSRRGGENSGWMSDVPAGAAWYSGQRVWAQPAQLKDFYTIEIEQPISALVLTPRSLDRPFFGELAKQTDVLSRLGEWSQIYAGLVTGKFPPSFPLTVTQKVSDDLIVLIDPSLMASRGK